MVAVTDSAPSAASVPDGNTSIELSVIIPMFNEEAGIGKTLETLREEVPAAEIIVVDDGSADRSAERARAHKGVRVLRHPFNRGYGAALRTGMAAANGKYIAWFDADNEHRASDLVAMVERLKTQNLAAIIGERRRSQAPLRGIGKWVIRLIGKTLKVRGAGDLNCGLRVFRRDVIARYQHLLPNRYSASLTSTVIVIEQGYPFEFFPLATNPRLGTSKVALSDGFEAIVLLLRVLTLFAPIRVFLRLGFALGITGAFYGFLVAFIAGRGIPVLAAVLMVAGVVVVALGLIADQISQIRLNALVDQPVVDENSGRDE